MEIQYRDKKWDMKSGMTARDALKKLGLDPESVLITINGKIVTDDVVLKDADQVKLIAVVSGGSVNCRFQILDCRLKNKSQI